MKLLNVPPFKVGDRVHRVHCSRLYVIEELRHTRGAWEARMSNWWYPCDRLKRANENTTEESPSGAAVDLTPIQQSREAVSRTFNTNPCGNLVHTGPNTFQYTMNGSVYSVNWGSVSIPGDTPPTTT